ncbi:MAG: carbon-nitrogen hydrolase family protein [Thermoplasmata archaeon]|nr:carbon-nitrogen hydrolase family protein [Thermoplasmata archaeon]
MRLTLAQLAPSAGDVPANLARIDRVVAKGAADVAVFPELFLSGYRVGDRIHQLALRKDDPGFRELLRIAQSRATTLVVGAPVASTDRPGETWNAAVVAPPEGRPMRQVKRFLPTYGPFEEGVHFTPTDRSEPLRFAGHRVGLLICYDSFFPEVGRELARAGAELLVIISASPVTSRSLFEKILPARAVENGCPVVYVNRVGVEDGIVFGGGTGAWDARGEPVELTPTVTEGLGDDEMVGSVELDLADVPRWRPFRPVLRDLSSRSTTATPASDPTYR